MKSCPIKDQKMIFFLSGAMHCETAIWNIQIFALNFYELKYLRGRFGRSVQLVPKTLEVWREKVKRKHGYMWSFVYPLNSSYKYVKKVKTVSIAPENKTKIDSMISRLDNGLYTCSECEYTSKVHGHMKEHVEKHIEGLEFQCNFCDKVMRSSVGMRKHKSKHH